MRAQKGIHRRKVLKGKGILTLTRSRSRSTYYAWNNNFPKK